MATRYVDMTKETSTLTGLNWQFTNGSTTVTETGAAGNAQAELAAGNYVRTNGGLQWYKVASVTDDDNFEITPSFKQANNTDTCKKNSEDGTAIAQAFAHLNQATTDEARAAGDIIKVRANQTHTYSSVIIHIDESGDQDSFITLKGCDSVDDPWGDGNDIRPILDFSSPGTTRVILDQDYWKLEHLAFKGCNSTLGALYIYSAHGILVEDCKVYDNGSFVGQVGSLVKSSIARFLDCIFDNNFGSSLGVESSRVMIEDCIFDGDTVGGGNGTDYGIFMEYGQGIVWIKNSTFGVTDDHDLADLHCSEGGVIRCRNVKLDSVTEVSLTLGGGSVYIEDDEQTHKAFRAWQLAGNLTRTTAVNRSGGGGSSWSILGEPNSGCGVNEPLYIIGDWIRGIPIYLTSASQTITVWAYVDSTGGGWTPNASEFYIEIEHHEGAADWDVDISVDTFAAEDQWESFAITLTPSGEGPAYLRAILKDYAAGGKIYIDPEPVFS